MSNLYVYDQLVQLGIEKNRIVIAYDKDNFKSIPIETIENILIFGAVKASPTFIKEILSRGIHLTWLSKNGSFFGRLESTGHVNIYRQREQFRKSDDTNFCLTLAKQFIMGKAKNQRTILVRANKSLRNNDLANTISRMSMFFPKIREAKDIEELMGVEGFLAKMYYQGINYIIDKDFSFSKRSKRPPRDPFNAIISFGYTLLHYEIFTILQTKGLNCYAGFMHSDKHNHPALCSDLMEEWRAILVDSLAIALLNNGKITKEDFDYNSDNGGVYLTKNACKIFIKNFETRLRQETSYVEEVSYKMSFRRIIEYQVMQLIKSIENNNANLYKPILIR